MKKEDFAFIKQIKFEFNNAPTDLARDSNHC